MALGRSKTNRFVVILKATVYFLLAGIPYLILFNLYAIPSLNAPVSNVESSKSKFSFSPNEMLAKSMSSSSPNVLAFNPAFRHTRSVENLYEDLLQSNPAERSNYVVMEVGCFRLKQSASAAHLGYNVLSYEASPTNYKFMMTEWNQESEEVQKLLRVHNNAVSDVSGATLTFDALGGTGDHVAGMELDAAQKTKYDVRGKKIKVQTVALDDVIEELPKSQSVFLLKIDVQGHEAHVFKGLQKSLQQQKIRYILFEYWVDAIDNAANEPPGTCVGVNEILIPLMNAGYTLFDLRVNKHPNANTRGLPIRQKYSYFRPLEFFSNCEWYVEQGKNTPDYTMGYWTDVLAVHSGEMEEKSEETIEETSEENPL